MKFSGDSAQLEKLYQGNHADLIFVELGQGFDNFPFSPKLPDKFRVIVVRLDEISTSGSHAGSRLDQVRPKSSLTKHDLIWV